jgi:L-seryl-tRNA(Ser) seleniumtransferase
MIAAPAEELCARAAAWAAALGQGEVIAGESTIGGGSLPGETLPTFVLVFSASSPDRLLARLRQQNPPIIARLQDDRVVLDPRTVLPEQEEALLSGLKQALEITR